MMQKYFEDKALPFKDPENVSITDVETKKIREGHYKKTKTLLWMAPIIYLIFCLVVENCVIKQAKNYIPIKFVEPCNFPDIISVEKYIELKVEFGKATKGLAAINSVVKFDDMPPEFSTILLNKNKIFLAATVFLKQNFITKKSIAQNVTKKM
uniref:Uncharacterized protein n=1 Tax=Panagrolaimus superbus TaxID=310955 RepID=A0A914Z9H7_9BILA